MYTIIKDHGVIQSIQDNKNGRSIPIDEGNRDYQDYLEWVRAGNTANQFDSALSLESAKAQVYSWASSIRVQVAGTSDPIEISAWNNKLRIAQAVIAGDASPQDIAAAQTEASLRGEGESVNAFCQKVIANAQQYAVAVATIDGMTKQAIATLETITDPSQFPKALEDLRAGADAALAKLMGAQ